MDQAFSSAVQVLNDRSTVVCLGVRLRPLTVGHLFLLQELENAFPDHPENAGEPDIVTAVLVCSQDHKRARKMLAAGRRARLAMAVWGWLMRKRSFKAEAALFALYLQEQLGTPEQDAIGGAGGELRAPLCWRLMAMLMADFNLSRAEALDLPVAFALVLWAVEADRRGASKLASERQIAFRAAVREMEARRAKGEEANAS